MSPRVAEAGVWSEGLKYLLLIVKGGAREGVQHTSCVMHLPTAQLHGDKVTIHTFSLIMSMIVCYGVFLSVCQFVKLRDIRGGFRWYYVLQRYVHRKYLEGYCHRLLGLQRVADFLTMC